MDASKHVVNFISSIRGKQLFKLTDFDDEVKHFIMEKMGEYAHLGYLFMGTNDIASDPDNLESHAEEVVALARKFTSSYCCRFMGIVECYPRFGPGGFPQMDPKTDWEVFNLNFMKKVVRFNTFLFEKIKALNDKMIFFVPMKGFHEDPTEYLNEKGLHLTREGEAMLLVKLKRLSINYCHNNRKENWRD